MELILYQSQELLSIKKTDLCKGWLVVLLVDTLEIPLRIVVELDAVSVRLRHSLILRTALVVSLSQERFTPPHLQLRIGAAQLGIKRDLLLLCLRALLLVLEVYRRGLPLVVDEQCSLVRGVWLSSLLVAAWEDLGVVVLVYRDVERVFIEVCNVDVLDDLEGGVVL